MSRTRQPKANTANLEKTISKLSSISGSTKDILIKLCRSSHHIPASIPDNDTNLKSIVKLDILTAHTRLDVKHNVSRLSQASMGIQAGIESLGKTKSTVGLQSEFIQQFTPLKSEVKEREEQRRQLVKQLDTIIQEQDVKMVDVVKAMIADKPKTQIADMIRALEKKLTIVAESITKLDINERSLQDKLDDLHRKTYLTVQPADRATIIPPVKPDEIPRYDGS